MLDATQIRKGVVIKHQGELYVVTGFEWTQPGKGGAYVQAKLKSLKEERTIQFRFRSSDKVEDVSLEERNMEYLYKEGKSYVFMDLESYEQIPLTEELVGESIPYVVHNSTVKIVFHDGNPIGINLPASVVLKITETVPGTKGDTVSNVFKPATLETGLEIKVPLYIAEGEYAKVDTRTGEFLERVNKKD